MNTGEIIVSTLERAAEACSDPAPLVYERLFSACPQVESLFQLDTDGGVRGAMLQTAFDCLIDLAGEGRTAPSILMAERMNHDSYGVPSDTFEIFFEAIRDTVRELNGAAWDSVRERAWNDLLDRLGQQVYVPADAGRN